MDLSHWTRHENGYADEPRSFGVGSFWAPEVIRCQGRYVMHDTARISEEEFRIGAAVSDSPLGPFRDVTDGPMFDFGYSVIDGHVFTDDDGSRYFYFVRIGKENVIDGKHIDHLMAARLSDDGLRLISQPVFVCQAEYPWEMQSSDTWLWNEGPFLIKHNGRYYLMFSANCFADKVYCVGYAVASSPMGPFTKPEQNPVLSQKPARDTTAPFG